MPGLDGFQTLERIRELSDVPVLMLTGRDAELDAVRALKGGADHYEQKPFRHHELMARVGAALRRRPDRVEAPEIYQDSLLTLDVKQRSVTVDDRPVSLTPLEFKLLRALVQHPGQVLSRGQLLELVWGGDGSRPSRSRTTSVISVASSERWSRSRPCAASATASTRRRGRGGRRGALSPERRPQAGR